MMIFPPGRQGTTTPGGRRAPPVSELFISFTFWLFSFVLFVLL